MSATSLQRARWLSAQASGTSQSLMETLARVTLRDAGLSIRPQHHVSGVGRVDLLVEDAVVVELDGRTYHSDEHAFVNDRRRDRRLLLAGYSVLRYAYADVVKRPRRIVADVKAALQVRHGR